MRCPEWRSLELRREREPVAWSAALTHFDECPHCRDEALAAEPALLFRRLPAPGISADEIADMKLSVAALRRAGAQSRRAIDLAGTPWLKAAALAVLLIGAALIEAGNPGIAGPGGAIPAGADTCVQWLADAASPVAGSSFAALEEMPLVEFVDPAFGSVVEVVDDKVSLLLVLPPSDV